MDIADGTRADIRPLARGAILAVLGGKGGPAAADRVLAHAEALGVDPLDYCAHRLKLGDTEVMRRAAHWAGFGFYEFVPERVPVHPRLHGLDHLGMISTLKATVLDREITFCAPGMPGLLRLAGAATQEPSLRRRCCIVTGRALRARLASACSETLMDESRQRLTRRWPYASANVDLPIGVRSGFVLLFLLATLAVTAAPLVPFGAVLLPLLVLLLAVPALLRLAAAVTPRRDADPVPLLGDAELPVYSVLIRCATRPRWCRSSGRR